MSWQDPKSVAKFRNSSHYRVSRWERLRYYLRHTFARRR